MQPNSEVVVGCGSIGQRHIRNASKLGVTEIVGVDKKETSRQEAIEAGATATYADIDSALRHHTPAFGIVAVPNHLNVPIAQRLATADIYLFIEKPLSHTQEGVEELIETVNRSNLVTFVECNFRFQPGIRKLRELLEENVIDTPLSVRIEAGSYLPDWHPNEDYREMYSASAEMGGGAVLDYIHELNYCRWLFGDVQTVTAMTSSRSHLNLETEEIGAILLEMGDGTLCEIHVDYVQRSAARSCKVIGDDGILSWDIDRHTVEQYEPDTDSWIEHELPEWEHNDMYVAELDHFFSCVDSRTETTCDIEEGYIDLLVAMSAHQSAETGEHGTVT